MKHLIIFVVALCISIHSQVQSAEMPTKNSARFSVTTSLGDNARYVAGDTIQFLISTDTRGYLILFLQDASGNTQQVLPNRYQTNTLVEPGYFIAFPEENAPYKLTATAPFGQETLHAILTSAPIENLDDISSFQALLATLNSQALMASVQYQVSESSD